MGGSYPRSSENGKVSGEQFERILKAIDKIEQMKPEESVERIYTPVGIPDVWSDRGPQNYTVKEFDTLKAISVPSDPRFYQRRLKGPTTHRGTHELHFDIIDLGKFEGRRFQIARFRLFIER